MAKGKKTGGRDVKKGQVLNPNGARTHNPAIKELKRLTKEELADIASLVVKGNTQALEKIAKSKTEPVIRVAIAATLLKAISYGDWQRVNGILERTIGKVPDRLADANGESLLAGLAKLYAGLDKPDDPKSD